MNIPKGLRKKFWSIYKNTPDGAVKYLYCFERELIVCNRCDGLSRQTVTQLSPKVQSVILPTYCQFFLMLIKQESLAVFQNYTF